MADEVALIAPDSLLRQDTRIPVEKDDRDALAAKRTAIKRVMTKEIEAILGPLGYVRAGDTWRRNSALATSALQLQSSTYGFGLFINAFAGPRHRRSSCLRTGWRSSAPNSASGRPTSWVTCASTTTRPFARAS
jgi:hypothetical protein